MRSAPERPLAAASGGCTDIRSGRSRRTLMRTGFWAVPERSLRRLRQNGVRPAPERPLAAVAPAGGLAGGPASGPRQDAPANRPVNERLLTRDALANQRPASAGAAARRGRSGGPRSVRRGAAVLRGHSGGQTSDRGRSRQSLRRTGVRTATERPLAEDAPVSGPRRSGRSRRTFRRTRVRPALQRTLAAEALADRLYRRPA